MSEKISHIGVTQYEARITDRGYAVVGVTIVRGLFGFLRVKEDTIYSRSVLSLPEDPTDFEVCREMADVLNRKNEQPS